MILRDPLHSFGMTLPGAMSLYANVFAQKGRDIEVLTFHDRRLAFFKASPRDRLELQDFLLGLRLFFLGPLLFFHRQRFLLWDNQAGHGHRLFDRRRWQRRRRCFLRRWLLEWNEIASL